MRTMYAARVAALIGMLGTQAADVGPHFPRSVARPPALAALPITEVPSAGGNTLALFWSGDGNWKELTSEMSATLAARGVAVIGVSSRAWLTSDPAKTPEQLLRDSEAMLRWYLHQWHKERILLLGYSRGAGFTALMYEKLPPDLRSRVVGVGLLGAERDVSFEFHLLDLVRTNHRPTDLPLRPTLERLDGPRLVCVYGTEEPESICPLLDPRRAILVRRIGDHHFDRHYAAIAESLLAGFGL